MKTQARQILLCITALLLFSCSRHSDFIISPMGGEISVFTIRKGFHESGQYGFHPVSCTHFLFSVIFDSSAIYKTFHPENQEDINKLFGFSDNNDFHHEYSARFGWNWARDSVRLYAYVYNAGTMISQEITAISIGQNYHCSIGVESDQYSFNVDNKTIFLPRTSTGDTAKGYLLFPYFGGDETAPHDIRIIIHH